MDPISVKEDLAQTDAATDRALLALADTLLEAVSRHAPDAAKSVGARLEGIKGGGA